MADKIDLKKKVKITLEKRKIPNLKAKVAYLQDVSGSAEPLFNNGAVQQTYDRVFAIADQVDDNHELDSFIFSDNYAEAPVITAANVDTYAKLIQHSSDRAIRAELWGGTSYAPAIKAVADYYGVPAQKEEPKATGFWGKAKAMFTPKPAAKQIAAQGEPAFVLFATDGATSDKRATEQLLSELADSNVYFQFIGIGNANFSFIEEMGDKFGNVGFVPVRDLFDISDEDLFFKLINEEFAAWVKTKAPQAV